MAHSPQLNPTTRPELNGKLHRYVTKTSCVRALRVDPEGERALKRIRQILSRPSPSTSAHDKLDVPSFSLIVRRSLKSYREYLETTTPWGVEAERGPCAVQFTPTCKELGKLTTINALGRLADHRRYIGRVWAE
jgi:hypothetical protein